MMCICMTEDRYDTRDVPSGELEEQEVMGSGRRNAVEPSSGTDHSELIELILAPVIGG